jgi:hypothetical protein
MYALLEKEKRERERGREREREGERNVENVSNAQLELEEG